MLQFLDLGMDEDDDEPVPLPNVNAAILAKVNTVHHRYSLFTWSLAFVSVEEVSFEWLHRISSTDPNLDLHTIKIDGIA